jgi:hypothetical protein
LADANGFLASCLAPTNNARAEFTLLQHEQISLDFIGKASIAGRAW